MPSLSELKTLQSYPLERKILISLTRILEAYKTFNNEVYVSFSGGGADSTVLADIVAKACCILNTKLILWYCDTGLEYPELKTHVKLFSEYLKQQYKELDIELVIDYPKDRRGNRISFKDIILKFGYPIISKEVSQAIGSCQSNPHSVAFQKFQKNSNYHKKFGDKYMMYRYAFLLKAPFKISNYCCTAMKKTPSYKFAKERNLKCVITGMMAEESRLRRMTWTHQGCNAFSKVHPSSEPLSFWTKQDIFEYIIKYELPIAKCYGTIVKDTDNKYAFTKLDRTGCMYCMFGYNYLREDHRFEILQKDYPAIYQWCMKSIEEGGLGLQKVLDYIKEHLGNKSI